MSRTSWKLFVVVACACRSSSSDEDDEQIFTRAWNQAQMKLTNDINDDELYRQKQANSVLNVVYMYVASCGKRTRICQNLF